MALKLLVEKALGVSQFLKRLPFTFIMMTLTHAKYGFFYKKFNFSANFFTHKVYGSILT